MVSKAARLATRLEFKIPIADLKEQHIYKKYPLIQPYGPISRWELEVRATEDDKSLGVWLAITFPVGYHKIHIDGCFGVLNTKNNICRRKPFTQDYTDKDAGWGIKSFLTRDALTSFRQASKQTMSDTLTFVFAIKKINYHQNEKWLLTAIYEQLHLGKQPSAAGLHDTVQALQTEIVEFKTTIEKLKTENKSIKTLKRQNTSLKRKLEDAQQRLTTKAVMDAGTAAVEAVAATEAAHAAKKKKIEACAVVDLTTTVQDPLKLLLSISVSELRDEQLSECQMALNKLQKELQDRNHLHLQCSVCLDRPKTHVLQCGHRFCGQCLDALKQKICPGCATPFTHVPIKLF